MTVGECVEKHTFREFLCWNRWLDEQFNEPSLTDQYIMQLTAVVASANSKRKHKVMDFKLKFVTAMNKAQRMREKARQSITAWGAWMGMAQAVGKQQQPVQQRQKEKQSWPKR